LVETLYYYLRIPTHASITPLLKVVAQSWLYEWKSLDWPDVGLVIIGARVVIPFWRFCLKVVYLVRHEVLSAWLYYKFSCSLVEVLSREMRSEDVFLFFGLAWLLII
jgi:hypothetical protein